MNLVETPEIFEFIEGTLKDLIEHKSDDGKIDMAEWAQTAISNAPEAVKAFIGADKVIAEAKNADAEGKQYLAEHGLIVAQLFMQLLSAKAPGA